LFECEGLVRVTRAIRAILIVRAVISKTVT
jgi:hypothetical protein